MDLQYFVELFCGGLTRGSIYALIALGYTMVYGIIELINFAHGEIYMIGAFTALIVASALGIMGFPAAGIIVIAALAAVIWCAAYGYTIEKIAYRPLRGAPRLSPLISAIGVSIFLQNYVSLAQTSDFVAFPQLITDFEFLDPISHIIGTSDFLIIVTSLVTMVALTLFIQYTKMGKAMRATAQNRKMAMLLGIDADRIISLTFIIGSSLAAIGGVLIANHVGQVNFFIGFIAGIKAFTAAVLGGIGSIPGAMVGGLVLGLCESFATGYISSAYEDALAFALLVLILIFRPAGILESPRFKRSKGADMNMILRALMVSVWFMALTFPLVVLKVDALNDTILFRWENMASIGVGAFVLSIFWRWSMERKARGAVSTGPSLFARALEAVRQPKPRYTCLGLIAVLMLVMPYISSMYQINIMISALIYIMLGLGLNIVVGLTGQLVLGYAAFYAVGAYT
ncbi:MAG: ABC transporter permease subunit, partial [Adlercreutzia sp.]